MTRATVNVTSGGQGGRADSWRAGLDAMTEADGPEVEARRAAAGVKCRECGGQATADRGRVFIAHKPRCSRAGPTSSFPTAPVGDRPANRGGLLSPCTIDAAAPPGARTPGGA